MQSSVSFVCCFLSRITLLNICCWLFLSSWIDDGYRLTYLGYDYLALNTYIRKGLISAIGTRIGVGKEADIYTVMNDQEEIMILKIHRLGRVSFRNVKNKR